jgi:hypothetical protein
MTNVITKLAAMPFVAARAVLDAVSLVLRTQQKP